MNIWEFPQSHGVICQAQLGSNNLFPPQLLSLSWRQERRGGWRRTRRSRAQLCLALSSCGRASWQASSGDDSCSNSSQLPKGPGGPQRTTWGLLRLGQLCCHLLPPWVLSKGCWRGREESASLGLQPFALLLKGKIKYPVSGTKREYGALLVRQKRTPGGCSCWEEKP